MDRLPAYLRITFKGRVNRFRYFWFPYIFELMLLPIIIVLALIFGGWNHIFSPTAPLGIHAIIFVIQLFGLAYYISLLVRRLHDLNRPGWWTIFIFVPPVNFFFLIYLLFFKGTDGPNQYGADPLEYDNYSDYLTNFNSSISAEKGASSPKENPSKSSNPFRNTDDRFNR